MKSRICKPTYALLDLFFCMISVYLAVYIKYDGLIPPTYVGYLAASFLVGCLSVLLFSLIFGSYSGIWKFASITDAVRQMCVTLCCGGVFLLVKALALYPFSGSITIIFCGLYFLFSVGIRVVPRMLGWAEAALNRHKGDMKKVVIIGAGAAGAIVAKRFRDNVFDGCNPVAFLDDDPKKRGLRIAGVPVVGASSELVRVMKLTGADEVIIAIPSIDTEHLQRIHAFCAEAKCPVKLFRSVVEADSILSGGQPLIQDVSIEDLLFRETVHADMRPVYEFLVGKTVLVTGGAGSIGSELCRQVLAHGCASLIIFDIHENGLFELNEELKSRFEVGRYVLCVGSVRDSERLASVFLQYQPDVVIHAAAHKHVPMMELNPGEAVKNNIVGTRNVINCCIEYQVKRFVLISTDKAVNPTNVMGATKRAAELLVQSMNGRGGCEMAAVRFGNVLGSNGSVIPLFKKQIAAGGPVTVTHPDMMRYFMTIPEAVSLVLSAGVLAVGGELFVLDMGHPVKIYDLAKSLITLSGHVPDKDIPIKITGLRPGEKMFEEIALSSESVDATCHEKIFIIHARPFDINAFEAEVDKVIALAVKHYDSAIVRRELLALISRYSTDDRRAVQSSAN